MTERKTIIEVIENPATAIINALENYDVPWKNNNYYVPNDTDYVLNHSATKFISRMCDMLLNNDGVLSNNALLILANIIYKMYSKKWTKLYASYVFEYNPIENYNMTEEMTDDITEHEFGRTLETTNDLTNTNENEVQGYNSSDYVPSDKQTLVNSGTQTNAETGTNTDTRNYTLTRTGNIGVTTSQQMIEAERKLWEFDFVKIVYMDIDSIMTINYFKEGL